MSIIIIVVNANANVAMLTIGALTWCEPNSLMPAVKSSPSGKGNSAAGNRFAPPVQRVEWAFGRNLTWA